MATIVFDTLAYANKLKAAGVPDKQAEVQAEALAQIVENNLATKRNIEELRREMKEIGTFGEILRPCTRISNVA